MANKFKATGLEFSEGKLTADSKKAVGKFLNDGYTLKSVGAEYLESVSAGSKNLIVSIGHSTSKTTAKYDLQIKALGTFNLQSEYDKLAAALEKAVAKTEGLICHEFFIVVDKAYGVFLVKKA